MTKATRHVAWLRVALGVALLAIWQYGSLIPVVGKFPLFDPFVVSSPREVLRALWKLFVEQDFARHVLLTLSSTAAALVMGIAGGFVLALLFHNVTALRRIFSPFLQFFNTLPRVVLAPFLLLAFGTGVLPRVLMATSFIVFLVYFNVLYGLTRIDEAQYRHVRMLGGSRLDQCLTLQIPVGFAWVIRAFPHAVAYGFVGTVFQEFVGGDSGIGSVMIYGLNELNSAVVMATVVILSLLGWLLFWLGSYVGQASAPWRRELGI